MKKIFKIFVGVILLAALVILTMRCMCFLYPVKYQQTVKKYATMYDVSEDLVFAVIKAESNFDKNAVSKSGAIGLMQVMDATGVWSAEKIGIQNFKKEMLYDTDVNIEIGCFYLSYLLDLYSGNEEVALAAYNAGHNKVDEWLADRRYSTDGKNLSKIPFPETEKYVKKVVWNVKIYDFLY